MHTVGQPVSQWFSYLVSLAFRLEPVLLFVQALRIRLCHGVDNGKDEVCYH